MRSSSTLEFLKSTESKAPIDSATSRKDSVITVDGPGNKTTLWNGTPSNSPVHCRYCGVRLVGIDQVLIDQCLDDMETTEWLVPCPRCGNTLGKDDIVS